jgi:branched-chain amino acid transport system substrate-binding protein
MRPATVALLAWLAALAPLAAQTPAQQPPAEPAEETYGQTPEHLQPYRGAGEPYDVFLREPPEFRGPGRDKPEPPLPDEIRLGVLLPAEGLDVEEGRRMRQGVELALADVNAEGGYKGAPFVGLFRDESRAWGASGNAAVELVYDQGVWAIVGALEDNASHVMSRLLLKIETPVVNTSGTDPTLTEHLVPWMVRVRPDDRQNGYRLARRIFEEDRHQKVAVFRANDRYARMGIIEFNDAARRLHRPIALEIRFENHDTAWPNQIDRLRTVDPDAIVLWGRAAAAGRVLAALREAGLDQPVYGPDRLLDPAFLAGAGEHAEGVIVTCAFDPRGAGGRWDDFGRRYREATGEEPDAVAAYAYDGVRYLVQAIREGGLNRVRIRDRLFAHQSWQGVTGTVRFDATWNNVSPMRLCRAQGGEFVLD